MQKEVTILAGDPVVSLIASMNLNILGIDAMSRWVASRRPECLPDPPEGMVYGEDFPPSMQSLFPHDLKEGERHLSHNELLVELAGRKCYDSFGLKAGKKSNDEYVRNTQGGDVPHASILYHAKMSFFFAGLSRRVSHELIRNYVGADRDEEGSPSQESTRFTHHYGFFICPPKYLGNENQEAFFRRAMQRAYNDYVASITNEIEAYKSANGGAEPKGMDRKRIYEASAGLLPMQSETSWIWTTNPMAIAKFVRERADNAADLEIQRFARVYGRVAVAAAPNLFPQPWMKVFRN